MQPVSGNQRPDLLTALMNMSLVLRLPRKMHLCRSSSNVPRLPSIWQLLQNPHVLPTFDKVHNPLRLPRETTSECPKVTRKCGVLYILTLKCASRHNRVHFFDLSISKSGPTLVCFVHFDLEMCFAPQRRALFRHRNFQKRPERGVFLAFALTNVLRATAACTFSSLIWPDGSAPAALASLLFGPPEPQIIGKTPCSATFLPFRICIFFLLTLSLICSLLLFSSLCLCPALLFICPYCRKFDFLTSFDNIYIYILCFSSNPCHTPGLAALCRAEPRKCWGLRGKACDFQITGWNGGVDDGMILGKFHHDLTATEPWKS